MSKKDNKVYARVVNPGTAQTVELPNEEEVKEVRRKESMYVSQQFKLVAEKIAKSTVHYKNWYCPELKNKWRSDDRMKRIDFYYPFAEKGPLLVDECGSEEEMEKLMTKRNELKKHGYRYIILESDTDVYTALDSLGEV